jgi:hypothetical protein
MLPGRTAAISLLASFALGVLVSTGKISCRSTPDRPAPLAPLSAQGLVRLGKTYTVNLGKVYASAWEAGAADLESGKPVSVALNTVHESWDRDRVQLFNRFVAIEFDKIVPQGKTDNDVTAAERTALAKAWRSFASGLRK